MKVDQFEGFKKVTGYNNFQNQKWDERSRMKNTRRLISCTIIFKTRSGMKVIPFKQDGTMSGYNNFQNQKWDESD